MTKKPITGWDFWRFCFQLGIREAVRGVDYFRFFEYPSVHNLLDLEKAETLLDLGCGQGQFPLFICRYYPKIRYTTLDIDESAVRWQERMKSDLGLENLSPQIGDSRCLKGIPDNTYDRVLNLGSIEHIPGSGDIETAREMGRVCKPGGKLVFSIPYSRQGGEVESAPHWQGFERRYDDTMLEERIIAPSGCRLEKKILFGEDGWQFSRMWYRLPFPVRLPVRHLAPLASMKFLSVLPESQKFIACGVQLVLQKGSSRE